MLTKFLESGLEWILERSAQRIIHGQQRPQHPQICLHNRLWLDVRKDHWQPFSQDSERWLYPTPAILFRENFRAAIHDAQPSVIVVLYDGLDELIGDVECAHSLAVRVAHKDVR